MVEEAVEAQEKQKRSPMEDVTLWMSRQVFPLNGRYSASTDYLILFNFLTFFFIKIVVILLQK